MKLMAENHNKTKMYKNEGCMVNQLIFGTKCGRSKNPCKICFQGVTKRNGLQCHGACKKWAHYNCLGYTPGKVHDIKAGLLTIVCPCPDCSTNPKEVVNNPPTTCIEPDCPSNNYPKCEATDCPKNSCSTTYSSTLPCECVNPTVSLTGKESNCMKKPKPCPPPPMLKGVKCKEMAAQKSKSCSCSLEAFEREPTCMSPPVSCKKSVSCEPIPYSCNKPQNFKLVGCQSVNFDQCSQISIPPPPTNDAKLRTITISVADALQEMCQTVSDLSEQIRTVMCRISMR